MEYTLQDYCNRIREDVKDYDYILIGLGDEALNNNDGNLIDMLNKFGELLDKNNYFIISSTKHNYLGESTINPKEWFVHILMKMRNSGIFTTNGYQRHWLRSCLLLR